MIVQIVSQVFAAIVLLIVLFCVGSQAQSTRTFLPWVPCPHIFEFVPDGGQYIGIITLRGVSYGETTIEAEFSIPGIMHFEQNAGHISLSFHQDKIDDYIDSGRPITFRVVFPTQSVMPRVIAIRVNKSTICSGPKDPPPNTIYSIEYVMRVRSSRTVPSGRYGPYGNLGSHLHSDIWDDMEADFNTYSSEHLQRQARPYRDPFDQNLPRPSYLNDNHLDYRTSGESFGIFGAPRSSSSSRLGDHHIRNTPNGFYEPRYPSPIWQVAPRFRPESPTRQTIPNRPITTSYINYICGQENSAIVDLAINGKSLERPQFPWIVAIYKLITNLWNFQCGGNLISTRIVLSAAHCFKERSNTIPTEELLFSLGLFKLSDAENALNVEAQYIILHPDYEKQTNSIDADIAIVQLKNHVSFSQAIRPICLTEEPTNDNDIDGIIVGWGEDETRSGPSNLPKVVSTSVISDTKCIRLNPELLYATSNRTLCADYKDGSGPCKGDSGSGVMTRIGNKWILKGIVSKSVSRGTTNCNLSKYAIFTDVSKFLEWIVENMLV